MWQQLSWEVLAESLSWGCNQPVSQGFCHHEAQLEQENPLPISLTCLSLGLFPTGYWPEASVSLSIVLSFGFLRTQQLASLKVSKGESKGEPPNWNPQHLWWSNLRSNTASFLPYVISHTDQSQYNMRRDYTKVWVLGGGDHWRPSWMLATILNEWIKISLKKCVWSVYLISMRRVSPKYSWPLILPFTLWPQLGMGYNDRWQPLVHISWFNGTNLFKFMSLNAFFPLN